MSIANGYLVEGIPERNGDYFVRPWHLNRDVEESPELVSKDVIDLLPSDPFGMGISNTFTAITDWLEDLEVDYGTYGGKNIGQNTEDYDLFAGLNWIWNKAVRFQASPVNTESDDKSNSSCGIDGFTQKKEPTLYKGDFGSACSVGIVSFENESSRTVDQQIENFEEVSASYCDEEGCPHAALPFALTFLGVRDLLSVARVCKSLHSAVRSNPLLWRSIHIDQPLSERITDDVLFQLTSRAQGNLQCLSMVECPRITDDGLKNVLEANPRLTKLCVPGCTRLSIDGIVNNVRTFNSKGTTGIKHLRIGGIYGITHEHFEELKFLLGIDSTTQQNPLKPHFYSRGNFYLCDDDRAIDIEECPICKKLRLVYDCPAEGCQVKNDDAQLCRACTLCITRCAQCGCCINDGEYEETFSLDFLCSDCFNQLPKCQEEQDRIFGPARAVILQGPDRDFCLRD